MSDTETVTCVSCGIDVVMPTGLVAARRRDHQEFYCPNGHSLHFSQKTTEENLIAALTKQRDSYEHDSKHMRRLLEYEKKAHSATKGQLTKARKKLLAHAQLLDEHQTWAVDPEADDPHTLAWITVEKILKGEKA